MESPVQVLESPASGIWDEQCINPPLSFAHNDDIHAARVQELEPTILRTFVWLRPLGGRSDYILDAAKFTITSAAA